MTKPEWNELARMIDWERVKLEKAELPATPELQSASLVTIRLLASLERIARSMG